MTSCADAFNSDVTVVIDFGRSNARAIGPNGLPVLDTSTVHIVAKDANTDKLIAETNDNRLVLQLKVGVEIRIEVTITSSGASWYTEKEYTVGSGDNKVEIKLSQFASSLAPLYYLYDKDSEKYTIQFPVESDTFKEKDLANIHDFCRDGKGRIYFLEGSTSAKTLSRYNVDGTKDESFTKSLGDSFESGTTAHLILGAESIMADRANNNIYFATNSQLSVIKEDGSCKNLSYSLPSGILDPKAVVYNNVIFIVARKASASVKEYVLFAYKIVFDEEGNMSRLDPVMPDATSGYPKYIAVANSEDMPVADIYADVTGVYLLMARKNNSPKYNSDNNTVELACSLGLIRKYVYYYGSNKFRSKDGYPDEISYWDSGIGVKNNHFDSESIKFAKNVDSYPESEVTEEDLFIKTNEKKLWFYGPERFIGKDALGNLLIADNGFKLEMKQGMPRVVENVNRIIKYDLNSGSWTVEDDIKGYDKNEVAWSGNEEVWKAPDTNVLLWKSGLNRFEYCLAKAEGDDYNWDSSTTLNFNVSGGYNVTDIFCYDQNANLYILVRQNASYNVAKFRLKADGSYSKVKSYTLVDKDGSDISTRDPVTAIAVDISNPRYERLYFAYNNNDDDSNYLNYMYFEPKKSASGSLEKKSYNIQNYGSPSEKALTALVANNKGIFVAVKTDNKSVDNIKIEKYKKNKTTDGTATIQADKALNNGESIDLNDMRIVNGALYALYSNTNIGSEKATVDSKIFKIKDINNELVNDSVSTLWSYVADDDTESDENKKGYNTYKFIAIKPDKLVIASDGFYGYMNSAGGGISTQKDKVLIFNLAKEIEVEPKTTVAEFSKKLSFSGGTGFSW